MKLKLTDTISTRRASISAVLLTIFCVAYAGAADQPKSLSGKGKHPNILFILSDNQHAGLLGTYGNTDIRTPHVDELASRGVKFNNAFAASGMCSPTRATILTGLMPSQHGLHDWLDDDQMEDLPEDWQAINEFKTVPYALKKHGYQTAMIGKWHLGQPWKPAQGFDHWLTFTSGHTLDFWHNSIVENDKRYKIEGQHIVDYFGDKSVEYLEHYTGDKPFFLQVSFDGPYMDPPTNMGPAENRHYESYKQLPLNSFPRVSLSNNYLDQVVDFAQRGEEHFLNNMLKMIIKRVHGDHDTLANMASQNTIVDDNVGRILATLKKKGLEDNTVVIYSSDQGTYYGQQGLWTHTIVSQPSTLNEVAFQIPLIIKLPGDDVGKVVDELVAQYDLAPTIMALAGVDEAFENSPGESIAGLVTGDGGGRETVFYEQTETRGVRTEKYAFWKRMDSEFGDDELYDMESDPQQFTNLAGREEYRAVIKDLEARLETFHGEYTTPKYNLWTGGTAKGTLSYPDKFRKRYGEKWALDREVMPNYKE